MKKRTRKERKEDFKKAYLEGLKAQGLIDEKKEEPKEEVKETKKKAKKKEEE